MISRRGAQAIADTYHARFTGWKDSTFNRYDRRFVYYADNLYEFLYLNNFEAWMLSTVRALSGSDERALREFLMRLHTGESLVSGTHDWTWPRRETLGQRYLKDFAQVLIHARQTDPKFETYGDTDKTAVDNMRRVLELDGYVYCEGVLLVPEESVLDVREEEGVLESLIHSLGLEDATTIKHHLTLSAEHYHGGRWDDSISNSRKTLEAVLQQTASRHDATTKILTADQLSRPRTVRDYLERTGLLEQKEKETISQVYGLLSNTGGHPYIAQQEQARLMRHLSLTFCQFVLLRLQGALPK